MPEEFDTECSRLRLALKESAVLVRMLMGHPYFNALPTEADASEIKANIMLCYRHMEDAVMRLGKAIQAFDGGKSVYDDKDRARLK